MKPGSFLLLPVALVGSAAALVSACSATERPGSTTSDGGQGGAGVASTGNGGMGGVNITVGAGGGSSCPTTCSPDFHTVLDCNGMPIQQCSGDQGCDVQSGSCKNACQAAVNNKQSVGCEYYATFMDQFNPESNYCFAAVVANTWNTPAHITLDYGVQPISVTSFGRIPKGSGPSLTYQPFDAVAGIPPGEVVILFLAGPQGQPGPGFAPCPVPAAVPSGVML